MQRKRHHDACRKSQMIPRYKVVNECDSPQENRAFYAKRYRPKPPLSEADAVRLADEIASSALGAIYTGIYATDAQYVERQAKVKRDEHNSHSHRIPRERAYLVCDRGHELTQFERVLQYLGNRVKETKDCYLLDGKPCNASDLMLLVEGPCW